MPKPKANMARWMQTALTKPRFSFLHVVLFALSLNVSLTLFEHWSYFKAGFRDGWNRASGIPSANQPVKS